MGRIADFKALVKSGKPLSGTFLKTPHHNMIEVMAQSGLDFVCLDAEHAPFDRAAIDACMAVSRALDYPVLVRVGDSSPREILWALDCGAAGIVVPHVDSVERAEEIARTARFGKGGRGFAGTPRWGGFGTEKMADLLERSHQETVVFAQIEEDYAVPCGGGFGGANIAGVAFSMCLGGLADCCHCIANQIICHCCMAQADGKIRGTREKRIDTINCGNLIG